MKKIVLAMLLVAAVTAVAQTTPAAQPSAAPPPAASPQSSTPPAPAAAAAPAPAPTPQKKEIKDPAEYNAYVGAVQQSDPAAKVSGLEAFLTQYPSSVMKEDALELLMGAYQATNNQAKTLDTAQKVLLANPCNIRALALLAFTKQAMAVGGQNSAQSFADAGQQSAKGLQCLQTAVKPEGTSDADWQKLKTQTTVIFNGAAGLAAFQAKDYAHAEQYLTAAVQADPTNLLDVYDLGLSYLAVGAAENDPNGLYFIARAANLQTSAAGKEAIAKFGRGKYKNYHGSEDGWNDVMAAAATSPVPPANFTVTKYVPPTLAQQAADLVKTKQVKDMPFAEWQLVLSEGAPADADKVWTELKGKPLQMIAHIISIDTSDKAATKLELAGSSDDIDAKRADIDLTMSGALTPKQTPKEDTDFSFSGTPVSYVAKPFVMTMDHGALLVAAKPAPVHKKPTPH
jgi:tetratricopeptide (TPR) repeat protein